jgi:hypothetical protein
MAVIVANGKNCDLHQIFMLIIKENLIQHSVLTIFNNQILVRVIANLCCFLLAIILTRYSIVSVVGALLKITKSLYLTGRW